MRRLAVAIAMLASCVHDSYRCETDSDCTGVEAGRCEADGRCTKYDQSCALTQRSYVHADAQTGTCFMGQTTLANMCAPGQPPAVPTGCAKQVCDALPSCCTTGWAEACVIEAQRCDNVTCDTRVAITASRGSAEFAIYDADFDPQTLQWSFTAHPELVNYAAFLAPVPGGTAPRLAGFTAANTLAIDDGTSVALDPTREYHDIASVDLDRDLRDTLVLDWQNADLHLQQFTVFKLDGNYEQRDIDTGNSSRMEWGAIDDGDGFPDVVASNADSYKVLHNTADSSGTRTLTTQTTDSFEGSNTGGAGGATHEFEWADVDGDGHEDMIAFGNQIRVTNAGSGSATTVIDCNAPMVNPTCALESAAFNGAVLPGSPPRIIEAPFTSPPSTRELWSITVNGDGTISSVDLPILDPACGSACSFEAVIVRDFDGDHLPDILAIDTQLTFAMALSTKDATLKTFSQMKPLPVPVPQPYNVIRTSVSGTQR
ncbi:MAG: VCBS repeat-containing protein [Kofleriaceae bacterium]